MNNYVKYLATLGFIVSTIACKNEKQAKTEHNLPNTNYVEKNATNDSLVQVLAWKIEDALYAGEVDSYVQLFDLDTFGDLATYTPYDNPKAANFKREFKSGLREGMVDVPKRIISVLDNEGSYDFISYSYDDSAQTYKILFRLYSEIEGINYHEYRVSTLGEASTFHDIHVYLNGEFMSGTVNKMYLTSLPKGFLGQILHKEEMQDLSNLQNASFHVKQGQFSMANQSLDNIKGSLRNQKIYHVLRITASSKLDEETYLKALKAMRRSLGNDPTADLLSIDYFILNEQYGEALARLDNLQKTTGDDFIDYVRAHIYALKGDDKTAAELYEKVALGYPDFYNAELNLILATYNTQGAQACIPILDRLVTNQIFSKEELSTYLESKDELGENAFEVFVDTDAYQKWKS